MKFSLILCIICAVSSAPIPNDRIVYPDELDRIKTDNQKNNTESGEIDLLNDPNIFKPDNASILFDNQDQQGFKNPENGKLFEGDIVLSDEERERMNDSSRISTRTGISDTYDRWSKNSYGNVVIPYTISNDFYFDEIESILSAMSDIESNTCIKFQQRSFQQDYIYIESREGCYTSVARKNGPQLLSLNRNGCIQHGIILHELIHVIGFRHMHNHIDRDDFVTIFSYNIDPSKIKDFTIVNPYLFENFGTPYDYYSIMHYGKNEFSRNGLATILPNDYRFRNVIGQRIGLSRGDVKRINSMYQCYEDNRFY